MRDKTISGVYENMNLFRDEQKVLEICNKYQSNLNINPSLEEIRTCLMMLQGGSQGRYGYRIKFDILLLLLDRKRCPDARIEEEHWWSTLDYYGYNTIEGSILVEYLVKNGYALESNAIKLLDKVIKEFPVRTLTGTKIRHLRTKVGKPLPYSEEIELLECIVYECPPGLTMPEDMIKECRERLIELKSMAGTTDSKMKSIIRWIRNDKLATVFIVISPIAVVLCWNMWFRSMTTIQNLNLNQNINGANSKGAVSGTGNAYAGSQVSSSGGTVGHGNTSTTNGSSMGSDSSMWSTIASIGSKLFLGK